MIVIKNIFLALIGVCSGATVAAGVFAFITMLGILPRLAYRTNTAKYIVSYETAIIVGGTLGNLWAVYPVSLPLSAVFLCVFGIFSGIFVGCLGMALAETLRVLPILINRVQLREGFPILMIGIAAGKIVGTFMQFFLFGKS